MNWNSSHVQRSVSLDIFWIFSCSLLVKYPEASQWASGRVDEVSNTWHWTWNWKNTKISGWRRGAEHDEDEDVTLETRGGSRSSGDEGRRRVDELWTTTLICPQQSLYVMSRFLLLLYRLRPSPGCSPHVPVWTSRTRQPAAATQTLTTQHVQTLFYRVHVWKHLESSCPLG